MYTRICLCSLAIGALFRARRGRWPACPRASTPSGEFLRQAIKGNQWEALAARCMLCHFALERSGGPSQQNHVSPHMGRSEGVCDGVRSRSVHHDNAPPSPFCLNVSCSFPCFFLSFFCPYTVFSPSHPLSALSFKNFSSMYAHIYTYV